MTELYSILPMSYIISILLSVICLSYYTLSLYYEIHYIIKIAVCVIGLFFLSVLLHICLWQK